MKSIFEKNFDGFQEYPALEKDIEVDIAVVGGGIAGLLTAYHLAAAGHKVSLFEARRIGMGTTSRSTATVTALQGLIYDRLGGGPRGKAADYFSSQLDAVNMYREIIAEHNIECGFEEVSAFLYAIAEEEKKKLKKEFFAMQAMGAKAEYQIKTNGDAIKLDGQGQFNPLRFLGGLPKNFDIYENTRITDFIFKKKILKTENGHKIKAGKIVIATRFPAVMDGAYYFKMYQTKSYVITFSHSPLGGIYNGTTDDSLYIRSYGDDVLIGGFDHRTGFHKNKIDYYQKLREAAEKYVGAREDDFGEYWSAEDAVTFDGIPFAGRVTKKKKHKDIFVLCGFNEWGMTNAMICSRVVANLATDKPEKYKKLFCPARPYLRKNLGKFLRHGGVAAASLLRGVFKGKKSCRHIHCGLKYNKLEDVWECPCHGSRYDKDGNILDGPAVKNLGE